MASKASMKRPAAAIEGRPAKRGAVADKLKAKCSGIADTIKASSRLPDHVKQMLGAGLGSCLTTFKQERHEYQTKFLEMVAEALEGVKTSHQELLTTTETKIAGSSLEKVNREKVQVEAHGRLEEVRGIQEEKQKVHTADLDAYKAATAAKKSAAAAQVAAEKAVEEGTTKKSKLESNIASFGGFKEKAGSKAAMNSFIKACVDAGCEKSLLDTVPSVLAKTPEERGTFGNIVVQQLEEQLAKQMQTMTQSLEETLQAKTHRVEAVAAAAKSLEEAVAKRDASAAAQADAATAVKDAQAALAAARKTVDDFVPEMENAKRENERTAAMLKDLQAGPLADFAELLEYAPPVVDVAAEAAPAEDVTGAGAPESAAADEVME